MPQPGEMTQAEYARHRGVSRQMIHKLVESGKIPVRADMDGKWINPADADFALNETRERLDSDDEAIEADSAPATVREPGAVAGLTQARTAHEIYRARSAELSYRKQLGELVPTAQVVEAAGTCRDTLAGTLKELATRAEEIYAAGAADGVGGVRAKLKAIERELADKIARAFRALAEGAAASDAAEVSPGEEFSEAAE